MMLYKDHPDALSVGGKTYAVDTDFRLMMRFELAVQHDDKEDIAKILAEFYRYHIPEDVQSAIDAMTDFYLCGEKKDGGSPSDNSLPKRCYAFDEDRKYITAAFRQQYGIDLVHSEMHWFEFSALFAGLTDCTEFVKIMQYRCTDTRRIKNNAEKKRIKRLQQRYALSENKIKHYANIEERDKAMIDDLRRQLMKR